MAPAGQYTKIKLCIHFLPLASQHLHEEITEGYWSEVRIELFSAEITQIVGIFRAVVLTHVLAMLVLVYVEADAFHGIMRVMGKSSFGLLDTSFNIFIRYL